MGIEIIIPPLTNKMQLLKPEFLEIRECKEYNLGKEIDK
jgi:hypothetical protein